MKTIVLYGKRVVGQIALSYLVARKFNVIVVDDSDIGVKHLANKYGVKVASTDYELSMNSYDLFICVHGTRIIEKEYLHPGRMVNIHPCLFKYKGHNPIKRYIENGDTEGSVASHFMTEIVDEGEVIYEAFFDTPVCNSYADFYNVALPMYFLVLDKTLEGLNIKP